MEEGKEEDVRPMYRIGSKSQMEHTQETQKDRLEPSI